MPNVRHKMAALVAALVLCSVGLTTGIAQAQTTTTNYPPGTTTSVPCTPGNVNAGTIAVGQTITFRLCGGFAAGGSIIVTVNGTVVPTKVAVNGAVTVVITVVSTTVLQVNDPTNVAAVCGTNTITATGSGTPGTSSGTFNLTCTSSTTTAPLALTGANIAKGVLIGIAIIILGAFLVILQRRRRQAA